MFRHFQTSFYCSTLIKREQVALPPENKWDSQLFLIVQCVSIQQPDSPGQE